MNTQEKCLSLWGLAFQSFLALFLAIIVPVSARFEGKHIDIFQSFAFLFVGLIGMAAYQSIWQVMKRIDKLENQLNDIIQKKTAP